MTGRQTIEAMAAIALEKTAVYEEKLKVLDKTAKTERKALAISKRISELCATFVRMGNQTLSERRVFGVQYHDFDEYRPDFDMLTGDDRESFLVFADGVVMVRHFLQDQRTGALAKPQTVSAGELFEAEIIMGVTDEILRAWQKFWKENGCIKCEVIK